MAVTTPVAVDQVNDVAIDDGSMADIEFHELEMQELQAVRAERNRILERRRRVPVMPEGSDDSTSIETISDVSVAESSSSGFAKETPPYVRAVFVGVLLILLLGLMVPAGLILRTSSTAATRTETVTQFLNEVTLSGRILTHNPNSTVPEDQALSWLIEEDPLQLTPANSSRLIHRFVILALCFQLGLDFIPRRFEFDECDAALQLYWTCNERGDIQEITFANLSLSGTILKDIGLLSTLSRISAEGNDGIGTIPTEIGLLTRLEHLSLSRNQFTGPIPTELGHLTNIMYLQLDSNRLSGAIPTAISQLSRLQRAFFHNNPNLIGPMPVCEHFPDTGFSNTTETILAADCDHVDCPCCSMCCPSATSGLVFKIACDET